MPTDSASKIPKETKETNFSVHSFQRKNVKLYFCRYKYKKSAENTKIALPYTSFLWPKDEILEDKDAILEDKIYPITAYNNTIDVIRGEFLVYDQSGLLMLANFNWKEPDDSAGNQTINNTTYYLMVSSYGALYFRHEDGRYFKAFGNSSTDTQNNSLIDKTNNQSLISFFGAKAGKAIEKNIELRLNLAKRQKIKTTLTEEAFANQPFEQEAAIIKHIEQEDIFKDDKGQTQRKKFIDPNYSSIVSACCNAISFILIVSAIAIKYLAINIPNTVKTMPFLLSFGLACIALFSTINFAVSYNKMLKNKTIDIPPYPEDIIDIPTYPEDIINQSDLYKKLILSKETTESYNKKISKIAKRSYISTASISFFTVATCCLSLQFIPSKETTESKIYEIRKKKANQKESYNKKISKIAKRSYIATAFICVFTVATCFLSLKLFISLSKALQASQTFKLACHTCLFITFASAVSSVVLLDIPELRKLKSFILKEIEQKNLKSDKSRGSLTDSKITTESQTNSIDSYLKAEGKSKANEHNEGSLTDSKITTESQTNSIDSYLKAEDKSKANEHNESSLIDSKITTESQTRLFTRRETRV